MRTIPAQVIPLNSVQGAMNEEIQWINQQEESLFSQYYPKDFKADNVDNRKLGTYWNEIEKLASMARHENHRHPALPYIFRRFLKKQGLINQNTLKVQKRLVSSIQLAHEKAQLLIDLPKYREQESIDKLAEDHHLRLNSIKQLLEEVAVLNPENGSSLKAKVDRKQIKLNRRNLDLITALANLLKQLIISLQQAESNIPISEKATLNQLPESKSSSELANMITQIETFLKTQNKIPVVEKFVRNQYQINQNTFEMNQALFDSYQSILDTLTQ